MSAALRSQELPNSKGPIVNMQTRMECQNILAALLERFPAMRFASVATVDGRSYAHSNAASHEANAQRTAAIMSSLMGLTESLSQESLGNMALSQHHHRIQFDRDVRIPSKAKLHTLSSLCNTPENLAMHHPCALDTGTLIATKIRRQKH